MNGTRAAIMATRIAVLTLLSLKNEPSEGHITYLSGMKFAGLEMSAV
jgi:hypothetical protein